MHIVSLVWKESLVKYQKASKYNIHNCGGTLKFFPDSYKNKTICNQDVDNYADPLEYVPEWFKI